MSRGKQIQKSAEKTERTCRSKKKKERGWKEPEDQWKNNSLWRFLHENPDLRSHHHSSGELWCVFWWVRACFMNTVVQLNIPLSRHSYVLDQCYHYSSMITKIWSDCPFKVLGREARFKPRHSDCSSIYQFFLQTAHAAGGIQSRQWHCWSVTEQHFKSLKRSFRWAALIPALCSLCRRSENREHLLRDQWRISFLSTSGCVLMVIRGSSCLWWICTLFTAWLSMTSSYKIGLQIRWWSMPQLLAAPNPFSCLCYSATSWCVSGLVYISHL